MYVPHKTTLDGAFLKDRWWHTTQSQNSQGLQLATPKTSAKCSNGRECTIQHIHLYFVKPYNYYRSTKIDTLWCLFPDTHYNYCNLAAFNQNW